MKQFLRRHRGRVILAGVLVLALVYWQSVLALVFFGYWPQSHIERLRSPIEVRGWSPDGLRLADGRVMQLPGFRKLPLRSVALSRATERGIEVTPEGRVIGLVKIWHWCGNDAVWNDVSRVDLGHLLEFMREGEFDRRIQEGDPEPFKPGGAFRDSGWSISELVLYRRFLKSDGRLTPPLAGTPARVEALPTGAESQRAGG